MGTQSTPPVIFKARGLTKVYRMGDVEVHALRGVDLELRAGEFVVMLGPSGSGKSTLLNILGGLDLPSDGRVWYHGEDLTHAGDARLTRFRREHVGFVFQFYNLIPSLTARENVAIVTDIAPDPMLPEDALAMVGLGERLDHFPAQLSGGEQQRVQLARVLAQVWLPVLEGLPRYLFLDEPVSSLDIKHQLLVMQAARDFADAGGGVIAVLHDLNLAAMFADRILALSNGTAACFGTPTQVLTDELIATVFDCAIRVGAVPSGGQPFILPQTAGRAGASAFLNKVAS